MTPRNVIGFGGALLCVVGVVPLIATGRVASALGASGGGAIAGASDPASMAFWFQLGFMRLFATSAIGLGAVLLWCRSNLTALQHGSLIKVLTVVLGGLSLMTVGQQIAIWNSSAGWVLTGTSLLTAAACAVTTVRDATGHAV